MTSIRDDLANALDRKQVPQFASGSMLDLGGKLGLSTPFSLLTLDGLLNGLPAATKTFYSHMSENYVRGWAQVGIQSCGCASFRGHLEEHGVLGDNYVCTMALLDVRDAEGKSPLFVWSGAINGQAEIGTSHEDWQKDYFDQLISDQWNTAKNSRAQWMLHVSTDGLGVIEAIINSLALLPFVIIGASIGSKSEWAPESNGMPGPMIRCDPLAWNPRHEGDQ